MTYQWIKDTMPDSFDISVLIPYPGSRLYDNSTASSKFPGFNREFNGLYFREIDFSSEDSFYKGRPGQYECHSRTDELNSDEIIRLRDK